jgi:hypothetical protein
MIPKSAGILDQVPCRRKSDAKVCNPHTFYPGQTVVVLSPEMKERGRFTISKVERRSRRLIATGQLPKGMKPGDFLQVSPEALVFSPKALARR